jgi:hypothetical protein
VSSLSQHEVQQHTMQQQQQIFNQQQQLLIQQQQQNCNGNMPGNQINPFLGQNNNNNGSQ